MRTFQDVVAAFDRLDDVVLTHWIEEQWILPARQEDVYVFSDVDFARVTLIHEMRFDLEIEDDVIAMMLSLLDQVYGMRGRMRALRRAIEAQPEETRKAIEAYLKDQ
jgi:chaperone modulatory protein CbpM